MTTTTLSLSGTTSRSSACIRSYLVFTNASCRRAAAPVNGSRKCQELQEGRDASTTVTFSCASPTLRAWSYFTRATLVVKPPRDRNQRVGGHSRNLRDTPFSGGQFTTHQ